MDPPDSQREVADDLVVRLLGVARRQFGMEMAWMSLFRGSDQVVEVVDRADASTYALQPGGRGPLAESYCARVIDGRLPNVIADTSANEITARLPVTSEMGIGSYVGTPIRDEDDRPLGMICCIDHGDAPQLDDDSVRALELIAQLVSQILAGETPAQQRERRIHNRVMLAIAEGRHRTLFQPIVSMESGRIVGAEALTRFDDTPERPDVWFAEAHSVDLGVELELATLSAALDHLDALPSGAYLALNASPATLVDPRLARCISRSEPSRIVIEITEHAAIGDYAALVGSLQVLRDMGVRIAVDDVGAGFSSFAHVLELSPHLLKMDISITRGIDTDPIRRALATAIVEVARRLGAGIVAEGVETAAELAAAASVGITSAQGHLLGRPRALPLPEPRPIASAESVAPETTDGELSSRQFELAMLHSPIGICLVALDGTFLHVNPALAAMLGHSPTELVELTFQELTHPDDLDVDLALLVQCLDGSRNSYRIEKRYLHADGSVVWGDLSVVLVRDRSGAPRYFVSQIVDVTERHRREETLATRALTDHLTGLHNRSAIEDVMQRLSDEHRSFGLLFCDLRGFKAINDTYGHAAGDTVLATIGSRIRGAVRDVDVVARWGGDEFVVVLPDAERSSLVDTARRLSDACDHPIQLDHRNLLDGARITVGTSHHAHHDTTPVDQVVHRADIDMYNHRDADSSTPARPGGRPESGTPTLERHGPGGRP